MSVPRLPSEFWDSLDKVHFEDVSCGSHCLQTTPKRIQQLRDLLTKMTNHANWHLSIFRLPPEILSKIFLHHARPVQDDATFADDASCATLLSVSQVCRRWREIVVRDPSLWTHVPIGNLSRTEVFMERSQGRPISLWGRFDVSRESGPYSTSQLASLVPSADGSLEHVEAISIIFPHPDFAHADPWIILLPSEAAPCLRALRLCSEMPLANLRTSFDPPFGYELPMLCTLSINSLYFSWEWIEHIPSLTSLVITNQYARSLASDLGHILNALRVLENLTELVLGIPGLTDSDPPMPLEAISMPHLKRCTFGSDARSVIRLLEHISVPGDVVLHVEAVQWDGTETLHFCNAIAQHYASQSPIRPFSGFAVREIDPLCFTFYKAPNGAQLYDHPPDRTDASELDSVILNLLLGDLDRSLLPDFITTFLRAFAQASPVFSFSPNTLVLDAARGVDPFSRCRWMSHPNMSLSRIAVRGPIAEHFAAEFATGSVSADRPRQGRHPLNLPYLEQLQMCEFDFKLCRMAVSNLMTGLRRNRKLVQAMAKSGSDAKSPIRLQIEDCDIEEEQVSWLRSACDGKLEWDGKTDGLDG